MNTYKVLKAIQSTDASYNHLVTAKEISAKAGFEITDNDLVYFREYITKGNVFIENKSYNAYCLLQSGINYIDNYEDNLNLQKITKINIFIAIASLIASVVAAITSILALL